MQAGWSTNAVLPRNARKKAGDRDELPDGPQRSTFWRWRIGKIIGGGQREE
jgi:hypothetical protein